MNILLIKRNWIHFCVCFNFCYFTFLSLVFVQQFYCRDFIAAALSCLVIKDRCMLVFISACKVLLPIIIISCVVVCASRAIGWPTSAEAVWQSSSAEVRGRRRVVSGGFAPGRRPVDDWYWWCKGCSWDVEQRRRVRCNGRTVWLQWTGTVHLLHALIFFC